MVKAKVKSKKTKSKKVPLKVSGVIGRVMYSSEKFSAAKMRVASIARPGHKDLYAGMTLTIAGKYTAVEGEAITVIGKTVIDEKWGLQFKVEGITLSTDLSPLGMTLYLEKNKNFRGIGPTKAKKIVAHIVDNNLDRALALGDEKVLMKTKQLSTEQAAVIAQEWRMSEAENGVLSELMNYNLTLNQAKKAFAILGTNAINTVKKNPYSLIDLVDGVGFLTIDKIAVANGTPRDSEYRIGAAIEFAMKENEQNGSSAMERKKIYHAVDHLLNCDDIEVLQKVKNEIKTFVDNFILSTVEIPTGKDELHDEGVPEVNVYYARTETFQKEKEIVKMLGVLAEEDFDAEGLFDNIVKMKSKILEQSPSLNSCQAAAAASAMLGSCIITGGAGTGKTYTLQSIMATLPDSEFLLAAPTGKAARRIEQSLVDGGHVDTEGYPMTASTVHRLLRYNPITKGFEYNEFNQLDADYVIVDEFSMMDISLTHSLLKAIDPSKTSLIIVGDHHQLPSVGCGNVLRDAIEAELLPVCKLETVMRQGGVLKEHSNMVLDGKVAPTKTDPENSKNPTQWIVSKECREAFMIRKQLLSLYENKRFEANGFASQIGDVQVLSPMKKGPIGTIELNKLLQTYFQKEKYNNRIEQTDEGKRYKMYTGDKIIQTKNDYSIDVMNGTIGFIVDIQYGDFNKIEDGTGYDTGKDAKYEDTSKEYYVIEFETDKTVRIKKTGEKASSIDLAYVLTVHKVQGSEFPCAVIVCHKMHNFMHHRGLLYTAVTRAKRSVIILGDRWGIENCGRKIMSDSRVTLAQIFSGKFPQSQKAKNPTARISPRVFPDEK